jgi:hypothetical protein
MTDLESLRKQIRYQLSQLRAENAHHQFEHLCRHLTRHRICSNILPATGPVAAGGDQGRDFETYRTYLDQHPIGDNSHFIGLVSSRPLVFACSLQQKIEPKIKRNVATIAAGGSVEGIHYFCEQDVPVGRRHELQVWARDKHLVDLTIHDGQAIAEHLIGKDTFWIAVRYLSIAVDQYPRDLDTNESWYDEIAARWKGTHAEPASFADYQELRSAARHALVTEERRPDLPMWMDWFRVLVEKTPDRLVRRRSIVELAALSIRGMKSIEGIEDLIRDYFSDIEAAPDALDLTEASTLLNYVRGAAALHVCAIERDEIIAWYERLTANVAAQLASAISSSRRADLLEVQGFVVLSGDPRTPGPHFDAAVGPWNDMLDLVEDAPLFPLTEFATHLTKFITLIPDSDAVRELTDRVDAAIAKRHGRFAAAETARDRAIALEDAGELPRAIEELHRTKDNWFAEETLEGSVIAILLLSQWYRRIGLGFAAKYYAFASAYIAAMSVDPDIRKRLPKAMAEVAEADYALGAWWSFLDDCVVAERAAHVVQSVADTDVPEPLQRLVFYVAIVQVLGARLVPASAATVSERVASLAVGPFIDDLRPTAEVTWLQIPEGTLHERLAKQLLDDPFADAGAQRITCWTAYGTRWTVRWDNTYAVTAAAEQFCAVLQIFLAAIHAVDICLLRTEVAINITTGAVPTPQLKPVPSNAGREWVVTLPTEAEDTERYHPTVFAIGVAILTELSLLPDAALHERIERLFARSLRTKVDIVRPYEKLYRTFIVEDLFLETRRAEQPPREHPTTRTNAQLPWRSDNGPTFRREDNRDLVARRYAGTQPPMRFTLERLRADPAFQATVASLRADGWKDWHILLAAYNVVVNFRISQQVRAGTPPDIATRLQRNAMNDPERADAAPVPLERFSRDRMIDAIRLAQTATVKSWDLVLRQQTPDFPAVDDLLRHRYHFWIEDIDRTRSFPRELHVANDRPPKAQGSTVFTRLDWAILGRYGTSSGGGSGSSALGRPV